MGCAAPEKRYGNYHDLLTELEHLHDKYRQLYSCLESGSPSDFIKGEPLRTVAALLVGVFGA